MCVVTGRCPSATEDREQIDFLLSDGSTPDRKESRASQEFTFSASIEQGTRPAKALAASRSEPTADDTLQGVCHALLGPCMYANP